jgi:DNA mismatch repair protein MSH4
LEDLLIIESQTIFSLEVFLNAETKEKENCFISNFVCLTHGGNRMLRANMLQPLSNEQAIKSRYDLVQVLLDDRTLFDILSKELMKFRNFEIITAKFIQNPKEKNIKSLKTYLSAIYSISHMCLLLKNLYKKIEQYIPKKLPVINKLFVLLNDPKIGQLKDNI